MWLRQSTASQEILLGTFLDSTDGNTAETGLTIANTDIKLWKEGATTEVNKNSGGATHVAGARYYAVLDATDSNTLGKLEVNVHVAGALTVRRDFMVVPANVYDSLILGTDTLTADAIAISGDTTAADNLELQYDTTGLSGETFPASQAQVGNLATGSAAISTVSESQLLTTGTEVNDYTVTDQVDQTYHEISDAAGVLEVYYQFNVGGNGVAAEVRMTGRLFSANDSVGVYAYNWGGATWDQIGAMDGAGGSTDGVSVFNLLTRHTGTGANLGKVRVRGYAASGLTSSTLYIDQAIVSYAVVAQSVGYADGAIWIDTNASNTNTESFVDGTADNPVSTWAAALTLSGQLNITRFHVVNGSAITLTGNSDNYNIMGQGYTLALNSQSIASAYIFGATVSGIGTGGGTVFEDCPVGNVSLEPSIMRHCFYFGTITNTAAGDWFINDPRSRVAGSGSPVFDFGTTVGNTNLNIRGNSGGWQLEAMGNTGTDTASIEGWGQVIEGTCTAGTVTIRGNFTTSGITNLTLSDDARFDSVQLVDDFHDEVLTGETHNIIDSHGKRLRDLQEFGSYEGGAIFIDTVNGSVGTTDYESGTILNPVKTIADANTLAASLNLPRFEIAPASSITFAASQTGQVFSGIGWTLALGGQDVSNSEVIGAQDVTGIATTPTGEVHFIDCEFVSGTMGQAHFKFCGLAGTLTLSAAANYTLSNCYSQIPGSPTPIIDFGGAVGNTGLSMRSYSGGVEIQNYGATGTDTMSIEGNGQLVIAASCTGGTIYVRGNFKVTDNASGAVTIVYDDNTTNLAALNDISVSDILTTQMTEAYAADGTAPTLAQAIFLIQQSIGDFSISGTTLTAKRLDGTSTAATYTLDDAADPTSRTRAT